MTFYDTAWVAKRMGGQTDGRTDGQMMARLVLSLFIIYATISNATATSINSVAHSSATLNELIYCRNFNIKYSN